MTLYILTGYDPVTHIYVNPNTSQVENLPYPAFVIANSLPANYEAFDAPENWDKYAITLVGSTDDLPDFASLQIQICTRIEAIAGVDYSSWNSLSAAQQDVAVRWCGLRIISAQGNAFYISKCGSQEIADYYTKRLVSKISKFNEPTEIAIKVIKIYSDFSVASLSKDIEIFLLPEGYMVRGVVIKHDVKFQGTGISTYTISVGIAGNLIKYASPFLVSTNVGDTNFQTSQDFFMEDWGNVTSVRAEAVSAGANLNQATAGSVEFYILLTKVKQ